MAGQSSLSFASLVVGVLLPLVQAQTSWTVGQPVNTTSGVLTGTKALNNSDVSLYAGIPYAKPPIGNLRWASPEAYRNTSAYNATALPAGCAANSLASGGATAAVGASIGTLAGSSAINNLLSAGGIGGASSEDCLYLNVWTKPQTGEDKKAVLVWLYGGGFQFGTSASKAYNGEWFAENEDVVLVSINYRTNVFGFPGLPGTSSAVQNPGLEDQRLALEWVRDNIEAFHGDPDRITMFGESAGAASTDMYQYVYLDDPIIAGSILESGSSRSFFDPVKKNNTADWYNMSTALGCGGPSTSPDDSLACLRKKSTADILNVTLIYDPLLSILGVFQPTSDEKVVFSDYPTRGKNGQFIKKPFLNGNNNYEAGIFKFLAYNVTPPISDNSWDIFNLLVFTCPAMDAANVRYEAGAPVWRFRYFGEFPNTRLVVMPNSGSYHVSEVPVIFETTAEVSGLENTANETIISEYMNKMWADFAKDPESAMSSRNLPQYNPTEKTLIYFGVNNETEPWVVYANNTDESCGPLVSTIGQLGGTNALLSDPVGFNAKYGALAEGLSGFVGIGDSNHADTPFGPPPIANVSGVPASTPSLTFNSTTAPSATGGTGTAPVGTGVSTTVVDPPPPVSTGTVVRPSNSSRIVGTGTGTGSFVTSTRPAGTAPITTAPGSGGDPPASSGGDPPASSSDFGNGISLPSVSLPVSLPPISLPSLPAGSSSVVEAGSGDPPASGSVPPVSANHTTPIGTGTGSGPKPTGTGVGTGSSGAPSNSANATVVDPIPATSKHPSSPVTSAPSQSSPKAPSYGSYGGSGSASGSDLLKEVEQKLTEEQKKLKAMFEKLYKEQKLRKRVADWARRPDRLLREVIPEA